MTKSALRSPAQKLVLVGEWQMARAAAPLPLQTSVVQNTGRFTYPHAPAPRLPLSPASLGPAECGPQGEQGLSQACEAHP